MSYTSVISAYAVDRAVPPPDDSHPYAVPPGITPRSGLGATYKISTPVGKTWITIPFEKVVADAARAGVNAAWPVAKQKLDAALPGLVKKGVSSAWPVAAEKLSAELPKLTNRALNYAEPRVRAEADRAIEMATSRAAMIASGLAFVVVGAAWWTRRAVKKGR